MDINQQIPQGSNFDKIIIRHGAIADFYNYLKNHKSCLVVCDENTKHLINKSQIPQAEILVLEHGVKPQIEHAKKLPQGFDIYAAIGSGTINDIVKYGAFLQDKPFVVLASAASMNGYASGGASLLESGYKKSLIARPARAIFMDTEIIEAAPKRLTIAGIGDSLCRATVEADNFLAQQIRGDKFYIDCYELLKRHEDKICENIEALCTTLIYAGVAMNIAGSSAPASQGEHMLAHYMEHFEKTAAYHGEQIAVTTIAMAKIMENTSDEITIKNIDETATLLHFGKDFNLADARTKYADIAGRKFKVQKPKIKSELLEAKLKSIGAPVTPADIGWSTQGFANALEFARYSRNRLTYLDVAI